MNDWRKVLRCRMSGTRAGRGWMVWAIWGMLGTAFTMEGTTGTEGLGGLGMAALLTAPFWLAFVLWPLFWIWRVFETVSFGRRRWSCWCMIPKVPSLSGLRS